MRWFGAGCVGLFAATRCIAAGLTLELVAPDGTRHSSFRSDDRGIAVVTAQGTMAVPFDFQWELRGNVRETASYVAWSPSFALHQRPPRAGDSRPPFDAVVGLTESAPGFWPASELKNGIAVFLWLSGGKPTQISPVPIRRFHLDNRQVVAVARFRLSEVESRGTPIVLLLRDGQWVSPTRSSNNRIIRQAVMELNLSDTVSPDLTLTPGEWGALPAEDVAKLLEAVATSSHAELIKPLVNRVSRPLLEKRAYTMLESAVARGRGKVVFELLDGVGGHVSGSQVASLIDRAVDNHQDTCARIIVDWMGKARRTIPRAEELATLALSEGLPLTTAALAGEEISRLVEKVGGREFATVAQRGHSAMIRLLLANGVSPLRSDPECAALILAAQSGDEDLAALLLTAGARPDPSESSVLSPLTYAVRMGQRGIAAALLKAGADSQRRNSAGATVLHAAVLSPDEGMLGWLLEQDVRVNEGSFQPSPLELALLFHQRKAVSALVRAGARLPQAAVRNRELLVASIAMDQPELLEDARNKGWRPEATLDGDWSAAMVAEAYESSRCLALLRGSSPAAASADFAGGDVAPAVVESSLDSTVRSEDREHLGASFALKGVVDSRGHLRCVTVSAAGDPQVARAIRLAAAKSRFSPALRGGRPVHTRISLPIVLPAQSRRVFTVGELDLPPVQINAARGRESTYIPPVTVRGNWASSAMPTFLVPGVGDIGPILEDLSKYGVELGPRHNTDSSGRPKPRVSFVIGPDGVTRDAKVIWAADKFDGEGALRNVASLRYAPGIANGRAVAVHMLQQVSAQR